MQAASVEQSSNHHNVCLFLNWTNFQSILDFISQNPHLPLYRKNCQSPNLNPIKTQIIKLEISQNCLQNFTHPPPIKNLLKALQLMHSAYATSDIHNPGWENFTLYDLEQEYLPTQPYPTFDQCMLFFDEPKLVFNFNPISN